MQASDASIAFLATVVVLKVSLCTCQRIGRAVIVTCASCVNHNLMKCHDHASTLLQQRACQLQQVHIVAGMLNVQWVSDDDGAGGRLGRGAVYFFCGHAFEEQACERHPDTGAFICAHCALDPAKQRVRRAAAAGKVRCAAESGVPAAQMCKLLAFVEFCVSCRL